MSAEDSALCARLWAKDPADARGSYPLLPHLLDTAVVVGHLWDSWLRPGLREHVTTLLGLDAPTARAAVQLVAGLHDVGKANPWFQLQERDSSLAAEVGVLSQELAAFHLTPSPKLVVDLLRRDRRHPLRRHEYISAHAVAGQWPESRSSFLADHWVAALDGGHHGTWRPALSGVTLDWADMLVTPAWAAQQNALIEVVAGAVGLHPADLQPAPDGAAPAFLLLSGLLTLADWLASDERVVDEGRRLLAGGQEPAKDALGWMQSRAEELASHNETNLGGPNSYTTATLRASTLGPYKPRPLQAEAVTLGERNGDDCGLWVCTYPTGEGKSEAAMLRHGLRPAEGFLFGLPTRATTDAMESRINGWLGTVGARALKSHQFAYIPQATTHLGGDQADACGDAEVDWFTSTIRKLVARHTVMTCDQILAGALRQRHLTLRLLGLANHHVVIDEVHTFDAYQLTLLKELLAWWGATRTRVTLLSATLPTTQLTELVHAYQDGAAPPGQARPGQALPSVPFPGHLFVPADPSRALRIGPETGKHPAAASRPQPPTVVDMVDVPDRATRVEKHITWAVRTACAHPHSPIGVIANTVDDCRVIALGVRAGLAERGISTHDVECLHSRMVQRHRSAKEARLLACLGKQAQDDGFRSARPLIVVGTQVIQASLDIDMDFLATDLAPAPDIIQRLGRQWRFEPNPDRATRTGARSRTLRVVSVRHEGTVPPRGALPYPASMLSRTYDWLSERSGHDLDVLTESQAFVDHAYRPTTPEEIEAAMREIGQNTVRIVEATKSRAGLRDLLARDFVDTTWADLCALTERDDSEALMRTRYIDVEAVPLMLFDSAGRSSFLQPLPAAGTAAISAATGDVAAGLLAHTLSVPAQFFDRVLDGYHATRGTQAPWEPVSRMLAGFPPVDLAHLDGGTYDDLTGFGHRKEDT